MATTAPMRQRPHAWRGLAEAPLPRVGHGLHTETSRGDRRDERAQEDAEYKHPLPVDLGSSLTKYSIAAPLGVKTAPPYRERTKVVEAPKNFPVIQTKGSRPLR